MWSWRVLPLLVLVLLTGVVPLSGAAAQDESATPTDPATPVVGLTELEWVPCEGVSDTECAWLSVLVDPADPNGPRLDLRLARVPAKDPAHKQGTLLFIPGGPGAGIEATLGANRAPQHIEELSQNWDVVSFDPRGVGESSPIRCDPALVPEAAAPNVEPPTADELETIARTNERFFESCFAATGELMSHLSAMDTAADIEQIRLAIGQTDGLIAYGGSYGSAYGAAYLERYGDNVKALVLDGVVDHTIDLPTFMERNVLSVEASLDRLQQWCDQTPSCALHGEDLGAAYEAGANQIPEVRTIVPQLLSAASDEPGFGWPVLTQLLSEVRAGNTETLDSLSGATSLASTASDPWLVAGKNGLFAGVFCSDYGPQLDYAALANYAAAVAAEAPHFAWKFWDANPLAHASAGVGVCLGWPEAAVNPPHRLQVGPHPTVLVANSSYDSATPLTNALSVWLQVPRARLLIADVNGHQSLVASQCAYATMVRYWEDPTSVPLTTLCAS